MKVEAADSLASMDFFFFLSFFSTIIIERKRKGRSESDRQSTTCDLRKHFQMSRRAGCLAQVSRQHTQTSERLQTQTQRDKEAPSGDPTRPARNGLEHRGAEGGSM